MLLQSNAFLPFGAVRAGYSAPRAPAGATTPEYLFHQKERDAETEFLYFETRYLDPSIGRFNRVDPAILDLPAEALHAPQTLNGYSFAANNPIRYGDSSGTWLETAWDLTSLSISVTEATANPSAFNTLAVVLDATAVALPFVPGGFGADLEGVEIRWDAGVGRRWKGTSAQIHVSGRGSQCPRYG